MAQSTGRTKSRKNGPVITYKFKDAEHQVLYDEKKISFEQATEQVVTPVFLEMITQYESKQLSSRLKNYIYPEAIRPESTRFVVVHEATGEVFYRRYLYTYQLVEYVTNPAITLYVTNVQ